MPTYQSTIPQPTDAFSQSQVDILNNFQALEDFMTVNHYDPNDPNYGKHSLIQFPVVQGADPATAAGEMALYTKNVTGAPCLFLRNQSSGLVTNLSLYTVSGGATYTYLPSGILIQFGIASVSSASPTTISLPVSYSTINYCIQVTIGSVSTNPAAIVGYDSTTGLAVNAFRIRTNSASSTQVRWMTIGIGA